MTYRRIVIALLFILIFVAGVHAQDETNTFIQLVADTDTMQTGERYTIRIEVRDVAELWSGEMRIAYDPQQIYVVGTKAGSPVSVEGLMSEGGDTVFNSVNDTTGILHAGLSMFSPAEPINGSGVVATFDIVPLLSGTAEFRFTEAQLLSIDFETNAEGQRIGSNPTQIEFLPVLLNVTVEGDPATPPSEATATPTPTATANPDLIAGELTQEVEPTLVNITAAPVTATVEASTESPDSEASSGSNILLMFAVGLVIVSGIGLVIVFFVARRRQS